MSIFLIGCGIPGLVFQCEGIARRLSGAENERFFPSPELAFFGMACWVLAPCVWVGLRRCVIPDAVPAYLGWKVWVGSGIVGLFAAMFEAAVCEHYYSMDPEASMSFPFPWRACIYIAGFGLMVFTFALAVLVDLARTERDAE